MKKLETKKLAGVGVLSLGLVFGMAGFAGASSGTITGPTGPDSRNEISHDSDVDLDLDNNNSLMLTNSSNQTAYSGDARVSRNTDGGDAGTGSAMNSSGVEAEIEISNSSVMGSLTDVASGQTAEFEASIGETGPDSVNTIEYDHELDVEVENNNTVTVSNVVTQQATSGDATVRRNTSGGSATTGDVSNTSSSSFTVSISN